MTERSAVQNPMLQYAQDIGWEYVPPDEALRLRDGETGLYFTPILERQLLRLNPEVVDESRCADILRQLNLLKSTIEGNRDALEWIRGERSVFVPDERRERNVCLVDFDHPDRNIFQVTDEWRYKGTVYANRADVVFLISGIPVAFAETKAAGKRDGLAEGIAQVRRYHRETPELVTAPQVFEVTELVNFYYAATWNTSRKNLFDWKEEVPGDYERKVKAFFDQPRFLRLLHDYIIFLQKDDQLSKIILRQHQTRAVERVLDRVYDPDKRRALIWHTQGSGKTLSMITIASRLLREPRSEEKPTVLMLVDRNELEQQLFKNIESYGIGTVKVAESKRDLHEILASDYRGLVVSTIHKFDEIPPNINDRESVVVLVDEAHRTTGGDLGNYLMGALPNATYIGFTGTPIDRLSHGEGTFKVFGRDDETGYLDKYSIAESIPDGTTVQLNYALAPSELRVDRETLEREFLDLKAAEGVSDVEELNSILDRAVVLKEMMKAPDRVDRVAKMVAEHFTQNVEPMGFKAFLVAVDREACALYKKALNKYLPREYSRPVYSPAHNDSELLKEYYLSEDDEKAVRRAFNQKSAVHVDVRLPDAVAEFVRTQMPGLAYDDARGTLTVTRHFSKEDWDRFQVACKDADVLNKVRSLYEEYQKRLPKILIVTEKLLTGFDAPILYCMYLDKPMRDHVLLQAIARVNRPYEDEDGLVKPYGFVVDFVGIFEKLEKALAFDAEVVASVIQNIDVLREAFKHDMRETAPRYLEWTRGRDDKAKEQAIEHFNDKAERDEFYRFFKQIQTLYTILSPDAELRPFITDYQALAELYAWVRNWFEPHPYRDEEVTEKTKQLLREHTAVHSLDLPGEIRELGVEELAALKASDASDTAKVLNLSKALLRLVIEEGATKPFLLPIGERAEAVRRAYEDRQMSTQQALAEFEKLAQEYTEADAERERMGLDSNPYAILKTLQPMDEKVTPAQAQTLDAIFPRFPDYKWNKQQQSQLRAELYKALLPIVGIAKIIQAANALLNLQRV